MSGFRTKSGGRIDRAKPVTFTFDGRTVSGFEGDTVASALLAEGTHMIARSFKYHRPRGIVGAGSDDPAGLVTLGAGASADPNTRASEQEIYSGLAVHSQNCWPSLRFDVNVVNDIFSRFLPAGFYYKTFMGPPFNWDVFEPIIRAAAGLGKSPTGADPDRYEHCNRHCEILIIGGGPAGISAALSAAQTGARVILAEETCELGGRLLSGAGAGARIDGMPSLEWLSDAQRKLQGMENVTILTRTTVTGYYAQNFLAMWEKCSDHIAPDDRDLRQPRQRLWRVRTKQVILATGALERLLVFHQNDRPGIMLSGAVSTYLHRHGVVAGSKPVVFTNNDSAWQTAFDLTEAGATIQAIIDNRLKIKDYLIKKAEELEIPVQLGSVVVGTSGRSRVSAVHVARLDENGEPVSRSSMIKTDLLCCSGGWTPNIALFSQSRGKLKFDESIAAYRPGIAWQDGKTVGAANGDFLLVDCLEYGARAGAEIDVSPKSKTSDAKTPKVTGSNQETYAIEAMWEVPSKHAMPKAFVDLQDDVTAKDLKLAVSEGYRSVEHAKRYTTMGMGTDQGKISNMNAWGILSKVLHTPICHVGTTTFRPPYKPVTFGALAGSYVDEVMHPRRTTPMHAWHRAKNAVFEPVGEWIRARAYPENGESFQEAVNRETLAARTKIGILDASTLGKIDIRGKDARTFLNRVYTNGWSKLAPGRCRYGLMLGEDGMVTDDGVTACITDDHFHMTTTSGGAANVLRTLEDYLQTEWPDLDVYLTTTTEQWAVISVCGPECDKLVGELVDGLDVGENAMPFMSWAPATLQGIPVRVFRISFTGELSYEINIPATYGAWAWEHFLQHGEPYDITPYGTEAMHVLRAEKGFIIVGQETDGTITPGDMGMDWIVNTKKGDFIGKRSLYRADTIRKDRKQLVGLLTEDREIVLEEGAHIIAEAKEPEPPVPMQGHVTSSYYSPNAGRSIALALIKAGSERMGETVYITCGGGTAIPARITETDFLTMADEGEGND